MEFEDFVMRRHDVFDPRSLSTPTKESVADQVVMMVEMGFEADMAELALLQNHGNVDLALAAMLEGGAEASQVPSAQTNENSKAEQIQAQIDEAVKAEDHKLASQLE